MRGRRGRSAETIFWCSDDGGGTHCLVERELDRVKRDFARYRRQKPAIEATQALQFEETLGSLQCATAKP
jgi:hypothetical protein